MFIVLKIYEIKISLFVSILGDSKKLQNNFFKGRCKKNRPNLTDL